MSHCQSSYLHDCLDAELSRKTIDWLVRAIKRSGIEYDAIAFRGMSGALVVPIVAHKLKKKMIMVRKEPSHAGRSCIEGYVQSKRYIVVDDFVASGSTVNEIIQKITWPNEECDRSEAECVGVFLYAEKKQTPEYDAEKVLHRPLILRKPEGECRFD